jgi:tetratricopeptide (TPR) repeat protein
MVEGPRRLFRSGNEASKERWEAINSLLWARLKLARYDYAEAEVDANKCLSQIAHHSEDVRVQAYAVLGDIALAQGKYSEAIRKGHAGLALNPTDPTDRGWLMLVLCEAYLRRKHIENAKHWFGEWSQVRQRVENRLFAKRASNLEVELDAERDSFYVCYREPKELKYDVLNLQLRAVLVRHVRTFKRGSTQEEQARALGISRQTYASWLSELKKKDLIDD